MHLNFTYHPTRPGKFIAAPSAWRLVDDFGTDHDVSDEPAVDYNGPTDMFGGFAGRCARREILRRDWQDPDFFRAECTKPEFHRANELMAFANPLGLSIEVDLRVDFHIVPAWDEQAGLPSYERAAGARLEILSHRAWVGCDTAETVATIPAALEEFCWQYLALERAREAAGDQS